MSDFIQDVEKFASLCNNGEMTIKNFQLENIFLTGICVNGQELNNISFKNSSLVDSLFLGAVFTNCDFRGTDLSRVQAPFSRFIGCTFDKYTIFDKTLISGSEFVNCHYNDLVLFSSENMPSQYEMVSFTYIIDKTNDLGFNPFSETLNKLSRCFYSNDALTSYMKIIDDEFEQGATHIIQSNNKFTVNKQLAFSQLQSVSFYNFLASHCFFDIVYQPSWKTFNDAVAQLVSRLPYKPTGNNERVRLCSDVILGNELGSNPLDEQVKNIDFSQIEFRDCQFKGVFIDCNFYGASFTNCDFSQAILKNCLFTDATFNNVKPDRHGIIDNLLSAQETNDIEISTRYFVVSYAHTINGTNGMSTTGVITDQGMFNLVSFRKKLSELNKIQENFALLFYHEMNKSDFNDMFADEKDNIIALR